MIEDFVRLMSIIGIFIILFIKNTLVYNHIESRILCYKNINFVNFPYLKNFVDCVIDYRVQNYIEEVSEEFVMKLKRK